MFWQHKLNLSYYFLTTPVKSASLVFYEELNRAGGFFTEPHRDIKPPAAENYKKTFNHGFFTEPH